MSKILALNQEPVPDSINEYLQQVRARVKDPYPYDRLMIHYRRLNQYDKELAIIKQAISIFREMYAMAAAQVLKKFKRTKIKTLSKEINQRMGLVDKKGNEVYLPEPLPRWLKRQSVVQGKIKKKSSSKKVNPQKKKSK